MKKLYFALLIFFFHSLTINGQEWLPVGTEWSFFASSFGQPISDNICTITRTEMFQGKLCSVVEKSHFSCDLRPRLEYFYYEEGELYYYDFDKEAFLLMHDFSAEVGDTVSVPSYAKQEQYTGVDTFFIRIDSISIVEINTLQLKRFHTSRGWRVSDDYINFEPSGIPKRNIILEKIGSIYMFFNFLETGFCDAAYSLPLKSIYIPDVGFYEIDQLLNQEDQLDAADVQVYPNPFNDYLTLNHIPENTTSISILDYSGQVVKSINLESNTKEYSLDMSHHNSGIYFLIFKNQRNVVFESLKVVKAY